MGRTRLILTLLLLTSCIGLSFAQPGPLMTVQNTGLVFEATTLTTNGVPGLTNASPQLMVSAVAPVSSHGGSISLVNTQAWVQRYDGTGHNSDSAVDVAVDDGGNVLVTGFSLGQATGYDFATIKYSADGTPQWTNRYDGPAHQDEFARRVAVDAARNVYVMGDSGNSAGGRDLVLLKYSSNGLPLWTNRLSTDTNIIQTFALALNPAGHLYVLPELVYDSDRKLATLMYDAAGTAVWTNYYQSPISGFDFPAAAAADPAGGVVAASSSGAIIKYSSDGNAFWTNQYHNALVAQPADLKIDRDGTVIVTGDVFAPEHLYVSVKYAINGTALWTNSVTAPDYQGGKVPTIAIDLTGNVFVTGGTPHAPGTNADFTTVKYNKDGTPLWTNRFFEPNFGNPYPAGTAVDSAGNFYFAGHSRDSNEVNYVTVKYTPNGIPLRTNHYNGPSSTDDYANGAVVGGNGRLYVTGLSSGFSEGLDYATVAYGDYVLYTPPTNFVGTDTFSFTAVSAAGQTATGSVSVVVIPGSLQFNPTVLQMTGQGMHLRVEGARLTNAIVLLASTDLKVWEAVDTNLPVYGAASFVDPGVTNYARRFYRARQ